MARPRLPRGLRARAGASSMILLVAVFAAAAAAIGPVYFFAAQHSILTSGLHEAPTIDQGLEVSADGPIGLLAPMVTTVKQARSSAPGGNLLSTTVRGQESSFSPAVGDQKTVIVWRDGLCKHLKMVQGKCPTARGDAVVSGGFARLDKVSIGDKLGSKLATRVVGIYEPIHPSSRYWFNRGYFPQEGAYVQSTGSERVDAIFTPESSFQQATQRDRATSVVDLLLDLDAATPANEQALRDTINQIKTVTGAKYLTAVTGIDTVLDQFDASASALAVSVLVVALQLLVLVWLLLFLVITDAAEARGPDLALAKLRGFGRVRTLRFGLAAPVLLLLVALPIGVLVGWAASTGLAGAGLRAGTPVTIGWLAIGAAAFAVSGGLVAAVITAWRTINRPVLEQWRRTGGSHTRRGWVLDIAVLVATAAGLIELYAAGSIGSASTHVLALLVPGLLGLAVAVLASRILPWACRRLFTITRSRGSIGAFLAVRQVARRTGGMRTLTILATAFALATFSIAAWNVSRANIATVAGTQTGAAAVLDVLPAPGKDLATTVDHLDPAGTHAMAVERYADFGNDGRQTIGVESNRLANIAYWRGDFSSSTLTSLARKLAPPAPAPIKIEGDRLRVSLTDVRLDKPLSLTAHLKVPDGTSETPLVIGTVKTGAKKLDVALSGCPCTLRSLSLESRSSAVSGTNNQLRINAIQTHSSKGWSKVEADLQEGKRWTWSGSGEVAKLASATVGAAGLVLKYDGPPLPELEWSTYSWPRPLPALVTKNVAALPRDPTVSVAGLGGAQLSIKPIATVPVPGAPDSGVIVDRKYAQRAAFDTSISASHEVWLAPGAVKSFPAKLRKAGVRLINTTTSAQSAKVMRQQGPSLALELFLAAAAAAAILASAGAVTGLHLAGRRRRYELAALIATGARRGSLRVGLLLEQAMTLGIGALAGIGAGILAAYLALPTVPEFVTMPAQPPLIYTPNWFVLFVPIAVVVVFVAVVATVSTTALVAGARPEQLREDAA